MNYRLVTIEDASGSRLWAGVFLTRTVTRQKLLEALALDLTESTGFAAEVLKAGPTHYTDDGYPRTIAIANQPVGSVIVEKVYVEVT